MHVRNAQVAKLGYAQACGIHQLDHCFVANPGRRAGIRLAQKAIHFLHAKEIRQTLAKFRRLNVFRGIGRDKTLHHREPVEMANGNKVSRHRPAVEMLAIQRAKKINNVAPGHVIRAQFAFARKGRKFLMSRR